MEPWHPFLSPALREEYLAFYDARARRWPIPSESTMVSTTFGDTFVRVQGPADGPPLVLLPGDSETSLAWIPVIEAFAAEHRVYAFDHIYDIGRSIHRRQPRRPDDLVRWLDELFDELQLHDVRLVGHSYGGWIASLYALEFPERLDKLVLLSPPTALRPPLGLYARAILYGTVPSPSCIRRYLYWYAPNCVRDEESRATIDEMIEEDILGRRCFKMKKREIVRPTVLSDEDWQRLAVPTRFLVGRNEVSYSAERAVRRLAAVAPHITTAITDGDHHLTITQPDWVTQHVLAFFTDRGPDVVRSRATRRTSLTRNRSRMPDSRDGELRVFEGATAVITGGASGIGRALGEELAKRGSEVVLADLQIELAEDVASCIRDAGGRATARQLDVTDFGAVESLVQETVTRTGRLDYMFNNAGITIAGPIGLHTIEDWQRILDVNLRGVVNGVQAAYQIMLSQGFGHIVNTASIGGLVPNVLSPSYTTTKYAVVGLSRVLRAEGEAHGIRVSALCPGFVRTPMLEEEADGKILMDLSPEQERRLRESFEKLRPMPPDTFAVKAVEAIANDEAVIVQPSWWKLFWWIDRLSPQLTMRQLRKQVMEMNKG